MMRIRQLGLDAFGHFSGKSFDFGPATSGTPDFQIIHGANEAGKTTTMEAFLRLLYGFPARDPYDFRHQRKNLQISGVIEIDGTPRDLIRLPKRTAPLVDAQGNALPDATLSAHLGGLSEADYRQLLCLDDDTLEQGGEAITNSKGDIGRLLFSAAAGISDLTETLDQMRTEADALYRPRSSKSRIAELKRALTEIERKMRTEDVPAHALRKLQNAHDTAQTDLMALKEQRDALHTEIARAKALRNALPILQQIDQLDRDLAPFAGYPETLDMSAEALVDLLREEDRARADLARLQADLTALDQDRAALTLRPDCEELKQDLEALTDLHRRYITAEADLGKQRAARNEHTAEMQHLARDLGVPDADALKLVVPLSDIAALEAINETRRETIRRRGATQDELDRLQTREQDLCADLADLEAQETIGQISAILDRFDLDTLAPRHAAATQAIEEAEDRVRKALAALSYQGIDVTDLPICPVTPNEMAELLRTQQQSQEHIAQLDKQIQDAQTEITTLKRQMQHLRDTHVVEEDAAAQERIATRDRLWDAHRQSLSAPSADAFHTAMTAVDQSAAARLSQASALGELRHKSDRCHAAETEGAHLTALRSTARATANAISQRISEITQALGLPQDMPAQSLATWITRHGEATEAQAHLRQLRNKHANTEKMARQLMAALSEQIQLEHPEFDTLISVARKRAAKERAHLDRITETRRTLSHVTRDLQRHRDTCAELDAQKANHERAWETALSALSNSPLPAQALQQSLLPLQQLREADVKRREADRRVTSMERDQTAFATRTRELALRFHTAQHTDPLDTFRTLDALATEASNARDRDATFARQIQKAETARDAAEEILRNIALTVGAQSRLFPTHVGINSLDALRRATADARTAAEKRARRTDLETELLTILSVSGLEDARKALAKTETASLLARLDSLSDDLTMLEARLGNATSAAIHAERDLRDITGDADIAALVEQKTTLELELEEATRRYLELDIGHRLAEEAIRRYRDTHRSDMLMATEAAFAQLTDGAYPRLRTLPDGVSDILVAFDAQGVTKQAQDMSKGTRFQLYLALRAAAYQQLSRQGLTLPFFCDDIFETFDETRTRAACRVMHTIGSIGQAIYLTHHAHVVDIAREVCGDDVTVHNIAAGAYASTV